jgi:excisionase family DNA binding protein
MSLIAVPEAAHRLGVGVARIHQRIADGSLPAQRLGSRWVIDESALPPVAERRLPGRPLSERSAWALIAAGQADESALANLAANERGRTQGRLSRLLSLEPVGEESAEAEVRELAQILRSWLRNRARRQLWRAAGRDLPDLRVDDRIILSGLSDPRSGIASGDLVEGYAASDHVEDLVQDYLLIEASPSSPANVIIHVLPARREHVADIGPLLLAADLAEHRRPREEARAVELLRELADRRADPGDDPAEVSGGNQPRP